MSGTFPIVRVGEVRVTRQHRWLIRDLWSEQAVGILGGPAKACKSWLGLDMAISVATKTPCLGTFPVEEAGSVLVYMAEDALPAVRERLLALSRHRSLELNELPIYLIDTPSIWLDKKEDQARLSQTIKEIKPKLLLLDPLVRMHRADENSAMEMAQILGFLRGLQRTYSLALTVVHHTSKKRCSHPGQALRGSSDIHAWTDSSLFMHKKGPNLVMTVEHRSAKAPEPMTLRLIQGQGGMATHLTLDKREEVGKRRRKRSLLMDLCDLLRDAEHALPQADIRRQLNVRNQSLGYALADLEQRGQIKKTDGGWVMAEKTTQGSFNLRIDA